MDLKAVIFAFFVVLAAVSVFLLVVETVSFAPR
jgi:hypothetical protein